MTAVTGAAIYFIIWWITLFMVLPFGVQRDTEVQEGNDLGAPAKHKRITALQAQYALPLPSQFDQSLRNISLLWRWFSAAFTGKFFQCLWPSKFQDIVPYQGVIDNHIGGLQGV